MAFRPVTNRRLDYGSRNLFGCQGGIFADCAFSSAANLVKGWPATTTPAMRPNAPEVARANLSITDERIAGATVTRDATPLDRSQRNAASLAGKTLIPQVTGPRFSVVAPVVGGTGTTPALANYLGAFADLARFVFGIAVVFFIAHGLGALFAVNAPVFLAGWAAAHVFDDLVAIGIATFPLTRTTLLGIGRSLFAITLIPVVTGNATPFGINVALFAVGTHGLPIDYAGLSVFALLAGIAIAGRAALFDQLIRSLSAGWIGAVGFLWGLGEGPI